MGSPHVFGVYLGADGSIIDVDPSKMLLLVRDARASVARIPVTAISLDTIGRNLMEVAAYLQDLHSREAPK